MDPNHPAVINKPWLDVKPMVTTGDPPFKMYIIYTYTSRRLVYRACVLAFSQESLWWPSCLSLGICRTFEAIIIMFGHKMWLIPLCFIFSSFFTCICTLLWTPGVERGCFRMPCFLMDLRFATGRQPKNRTFRFFSGAALSLHVRSKSLGCQTAQIGTGTVFPAPLPLVCVQVHETRSVA